MTTFDARPAPPPRPEYIDRTTSFEQAQPEALVAFFDIDARLLSRTLRIAFTKGFVFAGIVTPVATLLFLIGVSSSSSSLDQSASLFGLLAWLLWAIAWIAPWFMRTNVYAGHWETMVDDGGELAESALVMIERRLRFKDSPARIAAKRIRSIALGSERYYLSVRQGRFVAYVSVLPHGRDLFVSWTMWREQTPFPMLVRATVEGFSWWVGKGTLFHQMARSDPARAMRESVHNATRAGVAAALAGHRGTIQAALGNVPTESIDDSSATDPRALAPGPVPPQFAAGAPGPGPGPGPVHPAGGPGPGHPQA